MKLFFHYCSFGFSNCYVLGAEEHDMPPADPPVPPQAPNPPDAAPLEAIIIDPGAMNDQVLRSIENNNFQLRAILVTHDHLGHVHGLRTLKRIYNAEIFAVNRAVLDQKTTLVKDGDTFDIGPFKIEVISIPGHSADSAVYRIDSLLFTGDALTAGLVGQTASAYGAATQLGKLRSRLLSLPGDYTVLPGHGPPSSLEAERRFNVGINEYDENTKRKPAFKVYM
ncbi:MAG: MBL fold metallo-hydrolase [Treponema sp.]|jgi:glyoxylase-like metal-dependent hydrolase (beta-lactamase superfamily II)|nr:MBL fold metallo-hydrolase [Treponema sp.]